MIELFNWLWYFMCLYNTLFLHEECESKKNPSYRGVYSQKLVDYEVVIPQRVDENGNFISNLIPHRYNKRSTKESDSIYYKISIAGQERVLHLTPNLELVSPGAVIEIHGEERSSGNSASEKIGKMFDNLQIRKFQSGNCHYSGVVKGLSASKVALSTCLGLAGFIQTDNGTYTIEPALDSDNSKVDEHPHLLYKSRNQEDKLNRVFCSNTDPERNRTSRDVKDYGNIKSPLDVPLYIELLVVLDKYILHHLEETDSENYVLTVFNMAFNLFQDSSLGIRIKLSVVRIIRLKFELDQIDLNKNQDIVYCLKMFQDWQYRINPGDDTHPNHHDIAILLTRLENYSERTRGFLGVGTLGTACDKYLSAILCNDIGLRSGFIIAHEIGHLLGAEHDGYGNKCSDLDDEGFRTVMHPQVLLTTESWSKCTREYINVFIERGYGNCLFDPPSEHYFGVQDLLPGSLYNADFQCKQIFNSDATECEMGSTCDSLNCQLSGSICVLSNFPPAPGTRCGENMWCRRKQCLMVGERPGAVDGNWSEWSPWSDCSRTCGSGIATSERTCTKPIPSRGGRYCVGEHKRHKICATGPCDASQPSFRDLQCGEFNDWIYPEDGQNHTWKEYTPRDVNPCVLFCMNEKKDVVALRPRVVDGTPCYKGARDVCVDGFCKPIPCDLNLESNAVEDVCGVCHGDGTSCDFTQGQKTMKQYPKAITKLINVPVGAKNIKVEELIPTTAKILVRDKESREFYIRGNKSGMHPVPGSQAWLGMLKNKQQTLTIPGPVTRALTIWIERSGTVTVKWSMALPVSQPRKPGFAWDFVRWSPCSAICGRGTQKSEPSCMEEKAGMVDDSYCADLEAPPAKIRICMRARCYPRWMVSDWRNCGNGTGTKKKREVHCVKSYGEGVGESVIIPDNECPPPKPVIEDECNIRHKRDNSAQVDPKNNSPLMTFEDSNANRDNDYVMFSSNRIKFGSHKKYDEYLKNFNAISSPQRKSETIPLHLLDTPHFKHYYRVLQTSENSQKEINIENNSVEEMTDAKEDSKTKTNSLLSQIYKNTFSGNQVNYNNPEDVQKHAFEFKTSPEQLTLAARKKKISRMGPLRKCSCDRETKPHFRLLKRTPSERRYRKKISEIVYNAKEKKKRPKRKEHNLEICRAICMNMMQRKRSIFPSGRHGTPLKEVSKLDSDQSNQEKPWDAVKFSMGIKHRKTKEQKAKEGESDGEEVQNTKTQDITKNETTETVGKFGQNYTIRFGQILIDRDREPDFRILSENDESPPNSIKQTFLGMIISNKQIELNQSTVSEYTASEVTEMEFDKSYNTLQTANVSVATTVLPACRTINIENPEEVERANCTKKKNFIHKIKNITHAIQNIHTKKWDKNKTENTYITPENITEIFMSDGNETIFSNQTLTEHEIISDKMLVNHSIDGHLVKKNNGSVTGKKEEEFKNETHQNLVNSSRSKEVNYYYYDYEETGTEDKSTINIF